MKECKVLISACLLGENVKYDGGNNLTDHPFIRLLQHRKLLLPVCPEVAGGLQVPRPAAEQVGTRVVTKEGQDVTSSFELGAQKTLALVQQNNVALAILKARSPSCGFEQVYDGTFSRNLVAGMGVTARVIHSLGVKVFNEEQLDEAERYWSEALSSAGKT